MINEAIIMRLSNKLNNFEISLFNPHETNDPYYVHITTNLAKLFNFFTENDSDEEMYEKGHILYKEFLESEYNKEDKSEYDCIYEFIQHYYDRYVLYDNRTEIDKFTISELHTKIIADLFDIEGEEIVAEEFSSLGQQTFPLTMINGRLAKYGFEFRKKNVKKWKKYTKKEI